MKKYLNIVKHSVFRHCAAAFLAVALTAGALCGCGSSGPSKEDARKYTQAVMDLICKGEYDQSVKFSDIEEGKGTQMRDNMIDEMISSMTGELELNDEVKTKFREFMIKAFSTCRYSVGEPVKTGDGADAGYDVPVTIEPLKLFSGASETIKKETDALTDDTEKLMSMSYDELYSSILNTVFDVLDRNLGDPQYAPGEEVVVHYGIIDKESKAWGISEEDGSRLGEKLFSLEGLENMEN